MSVALATRGMIRPCCLADTIVSLDAPVMQQTLEVRPRIRADISATTPTLTPPVPVTAQEIRPGMKQADAPAPPDPDPKPAQTSTQELRPRIVKAEEE